MTDYANAIWMPSPFHWTGREGQTPKWIVLHGTAGGTSAQAISEWFQNPAAQVSANYTVGTDGIIVQSVLEQDAPYANGFISGQSGTSGDGYGNGFHDGWWDSGINPNLLTISIEHVKPATDNSNQLTDVQKQASFRLIRDICQRRNIPMREADASGGITGHYALDPQNRPNCPGPYPWNDLFIFLAGAPMTTLEGFPMVSQLDSDINAQFDCIAAAIAASLEYLTKQPYTSAQVKDAVYGSNYQGNTDTVRYVTYCAQHGVQLSPINGNNTALVQETKQQLAQGHPVLLTEIDPYMPASSGETHVVVAYACNADSVTVMDPYIAAPVTKTDQQWQSDLRSNQIWMLQKEEIVLDISQVSDLFTEVQKDARWHCKPTGYDIAYGILTYYRTCTATGLNGLSQFGLPTSGEQPILGTPGATYQVFERGIIVYDAAHKVDSVPGISGPCYPGHLDKFLSQSAPVPANIASAISTLHSAQATAATLQAGFGALNTGIQSALSDLGQFVGK
jgi:N-acetyl-anhydromuramyl-L-alanine amidase AmpD